MPAAACQIRSGGIAHSLSFLKVKFKKNPDRYYLCLELAWRHDMFLIGNMSLANTKAFGARLRQKRKSLGVTQKDLAMASGTGLRLIIDLEKGKPTCQIGKALAVAQALGLKIEARDS
jgi:y4mF family transcriptional regulator